MKKLFLFILFLIVLISCSSIKSEEFSKDQINFVLDEWHKAASESKYEEYFSKMSDSGVFVGTDATENWQNQDFKTFSKPYFDKGKGWTYVSLERNIYLYNGNNVAWFDELLDSRLKICRGSGVLIKEKGKWKIAHYVLSLTVPNEKVSEVVKLKAVKEDSIVKSLKLKKKTV